MTSVQVIQEYLAQCQLERVVQFVSRRLNELAAPFVFSNVAHRPRLSNRERDLAILSRANSGAKTRVSTSLRFILVEVGGMVGQSQEFYAKL